MREITIDGVTYSSVAAAARSLKVDYRKLRGWLNLERVNFHGPIEIRGVSYPSEAAAARALRISATTIREARLNGCLDRVGLGKLMNLSAHDHRSKYANVIPMIAPLAKAGLPAGKIAKQIGMSTALVIHYASRDGIEIVPARRRA